MPISPIFKKIYLLLCFVSVTNVLLAQRTIEFFDPDFDSAYACHVAVYNIPIWFGSHPDIAPVYDYYSSPKSYVDFYSEKMRDKRIKSITERGYTILSKKPAMRRMYFEFVQHFDKDGYIIYDSSGESAITKYSYDSARKVITASCNNTLTTFYFNNDHRIDSTIAILKDVHEFLRYIFYYDSLNRIVKIAGYRNGSQKYGFPYQFSYSDFPENSPNEIGETSKKWGIENIPLLRFNRFLKSNEQVEVTSVYMSSSKEPVLSNAVFKERMIYLKHTHNILYVNNSILYEWGKTGLHSLSRFKDYPCATELDKAKRTHRGWVLKSTHSYNCSNQSIKRRRYFVKVNSLVRRIRYENKRSVFKYTYYKD